MPARSWTIAVLIHINGLPGAGKTTLARSFVHVRPLSLVVEIDHLRTQLGQWKEFERSQVLARDIAVAMIDAHLRNGFDVVVPQFVGRLGFIERLEAVASGASAEFIEVVTSVPRSSAIERFRARRASLSPDAAHPESDVADHDIEAMIDAASAALQEVLSHRPNVSSLDGAGSADRLLQALAEVIPVSV